VNGVVRGLPDSGAQILVIHPRVVEGLNLPCEGTIKLKGLKTGDIIRLSFYWPTLVSDRKRHCMTCVQCHKRARSTVYDRVPISHIARADEPFTHLSMYCMGPLFPNQKVQYNYCLLMVDSTTRWQCC